MAAGDEGHLVCGQSAFRAIAAVTQYAFHSPKAAMQRTPASGKGSAENRAAIPASASILPRILALGPNCASHRRSLNANSLGGSNSAGSTQIYATLQRDILRRHVSSSSGLPRLNQICQ